MLNAGTRTSWPYNQICLRKPSHVKLDVKRSRWQLKPHYLDYTLEEPCGRSPCLALALEPHDHIRKSILAAANVNQSSTTRITLEERRLNLIATKDKIQLVSLYQCDSTSHNSNTKPACELLDFGNCGQGGIRAGRLHARGTSHLKSEVMSWSANTSHFVIRNICCTTDVTVCVVTAGRLMTIY